MNATTNIITPLKMTLEEAQTIGARIVDALSPYCDKIEIAGSVRRARPVCGDIDIVCLPRDGELTRLQDRLGRNTRVVSGNGKAGQNLIRLLNVPRLNGDVQIDLFIAQHPKRGLFDVEPGNYGSILLCRTGPTHHNIRIVARAKDNGLEWNPYRGVITPKGAVIAAETEAEIYTVLGLPWLEPADRDACTF